MQRRRVAAAPRRVGICGTPAALPTDAPASTRSAGGATAAAVGAPASRPLPARRRRALRRCAVRVARGSRPLVDGSGLARVPDASTAAGLLERASCRARSPRSAPRAARAAPRARRAARADRRRARRPLRAAAALESQRRRGRASRSSATRDAARCHRERDADQRRDADRRSSRIARPRARSRMMSPSTRERTPATDCVLSPASSVSRRRLSPSRSIDVDVGLPAARAS